MLVFISSSWQRLTFVGSQNSLQSLQADRFYFNYLRFFVFVAFNFALATFNKIVNRLISLMLAHSSMTISNICTKKSEYAPILFTKEFLC